MLSKHHLSTVSSHDSTNIGEIWTSKAASFMVHQHSSSSSSHDNLAYTACDVHLTTTLSPLWTVARVYRQSRRLLCRSTGRQSFEQDDRQAATRPQRSYDGHISFVVSKRCKYDQRQTHFRRHVLCWLDVDCTTICYD